MNYSVIFSLDFIFILAPLLTMIACCRKVEKEEWLMYGVLESQWVLNLAAFILSANGVHNIWCYQINIVISVVLIAAYINYNLMWLAAFPVIALFADSPELGFNSISWCVGSLVIIFLCVQFVIKKLRSFSLESLYDDPKYLFVFGLLMYYGSSFALFNSFFLRTIHFEDIKVYWIWSSYMYGVMCVWFLIGFYCREFSLRGLFNQLLNKH